MAVVGPWQRFTALPGITMAGRPSVIVSRTGALSAYVRGSDNQIWTNWQPTVGSSWHGWVALGGTTDGSPTAVRSAGGNLSLYAHNPNGQLYTSWQPTVESAWVPWTSLGGSLTS